MDAWWTGLLRARLLPRPVGTKQLHGKGCPVRDAGRLACSSPLAPPLPRDKALTCRVYPAPVGHWQHIRMYSCRACWWNIQRLMLRAVHLQKTKGQCTPGPGRRPAADQCLLLVFYDPIGSQGFPRSAWTNLENHILGTRPFSGTLKWVREQQVRAALGFLKRLLLLTLDGSSKPHPLQAWTSFLAQLSTLTSATVPDWVHNSLPWAS